MTADELIFRFCGQQLVDAKESITWVKKDDVERLVRYLLSDLQNPASNGSEDGN